jgi:hypothetical protein
MAQNFSERTQQGYAPHADAYSQAPNSDQNFQFRQPSAAQPQLRAFPQHSQNYAHDAAQMAQSNEDAPSYMYDASGQGYLDDGTAMRPKLGAAQWGGAIVSLALIVGLGVWGYNLMVRDVSGVPVIRDMSANARLVPEDPGGQLAMHQGLAVNSVTADGSASAPADRLTLAPRPMALTDEDRPMGDAVTIVSSYQPNNAYTQPAEPKPVAIEAAQVETPKPLELTEVESVAADASVLVIGALDDDLSNSSPVPRARPVRLASLAINVENSNANDASLDGVAGDILAALGSEGEMPVSEVPVGARLVQFGAFQNEDIARAEWDRLASKFDALMAGKTRVIETAESGGKTFYRLRALGFADAADSNRFCAALTARNAACVPARQR